MYRTVKLSLCLELEIFTLVTGLLKQMLMIFDQSFLCI